MNEPWSFVLAPMEVFQDRELTDIERCVLLALFSFRNRDTGLIYPKRETLAKRAGYASVETVSRATRGLEKKGWITKIGKGGKGKSTTYQPHVPARLIQKPNGDRSGHCLDSNGDRSSHRIDAQTVTDPVTPIRTDHILRTDHIGAEEEKLVSEREIVDLYHQTLPDHPKVAKLTSERKGMVRGRIREDGMKTANDWLVYFQKVAKSKFLCGKEQIQGKPPFVADFEWLIRPNNFAKVMEGKYNNRRTTGPSYHQKADDLQKNIPDRPERCIHPGCTKRAVYGGMCEEHLQQMRHNPKIGRMRQIQRSNENENNTIKT